MNKENMEDLNREYIKSINKTDTTNDSYEAKLDPNYKRQETIDKIYDQLNSTNWDKESKYNNSYRVNGKNVIGRTLKKGQTRLITPEEADQWYKESLEK